MAWRPYLLKKEEGSRWLDQEARGMQMGSMARSPRLIRSCEGAGWGG